VKVDDIIKNQISNKLRISVNKFNAIINGKLIKENDKFKKEDGKKDIIVSLKLIHGMKAIDEVIDELALMER
jgi:hypothetical protein